MQGPAEIMNKNAIRKIKSLVNLAEELLEKQREQLKLVPGNKNRQAIEDVQNRVKGIAYDEIKKVLNFIPKGG